MNSQYILTNAITFNPTGKECHAVASIATSKEVREHREYFGFNFGDNLKNNATVYKIVKQNDIQIIQAFVSVKKGLNVLECGNMETNVINKRPILMHSGLGRAMIALCCKISFDNGFDGYISFEAKSNLFKYYERYGAVHTFGLRMYIPTIAAKKLVDIYF